MDKHYLSPLFEPATIAVFAGKDTPERQTPQAVDWAEQSQRSDAFIAEEMARHGISDRNLVKPGIGEATRVLLRRLPERLVLRDPKLPAVQHLINLAREKQVPIEIRPSLHLNAVSIIMSAADA